MLIMSEHTFLFWELEDNINQRKINLRRSEHLSSNIVDEILAYTLRSTLALKCIFGGIK